MPRSWLLCELAGSLYAFTLRYSAIFDGYPPSLLLNLSCSSRGVILTVGILVMTTARKIREELARYLSGELDYNSFQDWFLVVSLGEFGDSESFDLSNKIEGLMAEASHMGWVESGLKSELSKAACMLPSSNLGWSKFGYAPEVETRKLER